MEYLHLESLVMALLIVSMVWTHLQRATDGSVYTQHGRRQAIGLTAVFVVLSAGFGAALLRVSPLLAVEIAAGMTLSLLHPANALCLFVHLFYLRPWEIYPDNPVLLALPKILFALWMFSWLIHPAMHARPGPSARRALGWILGFSAWLFISTFFVSNAGELQSMWFDLYFKAMIVLVMCMYSLESERSVLQFQMTIVISTLALVVMGLYRYFTMGGDGGRLGLMGMLSDPNDLATIVILALPFALRSVFLKPRWTLEQVFGLIFAALAGVMIWYTRSRGAIVAIGFQLIVMYFSRVPKDKRGRALLMAGLIAAAGVVVIRIIPREAEDLSASQASRIIYWKAAAKMAVRHPVFGVGYNQFPVEYDSYSGDDKFEWGRRTCHSSWFLALSETGFVGGGMYLMFFGLLFGIAWRARRQRPAQLYALAGYAAGMSFLSHTYTSYPYILSGLILASQSLAEKEPTSVA